MTKQSYHTHPEGTSLTTEIHEGAGAIAWICLAIAVTSAVYAVWFAVSVMS